ncbi:hypothetical protein D9M72_268730 [compost metagenome]
MLDAKLISDEAAWPWEAPPVALVARCSAALLSQLAYDRPVYLLIDGFSGSPEGLGEVGRHRRHAIDVERLKVPPDRAPYLLELEDRHDPLLDLSLVLAIQEHLNACADGSGPSRVGGWLQTHRHGGNGATLARQLRGLFHARGAPGKGRYLRLADRRVLGLLHQAPRAHSVLPLPPIDWSSSLQGIASWAYLDMNFDVQALRGAAGDSLPRPLKLEAPHWTLPVRAEAINRTLMAWQRTRRRLPADALAQALHKVGNASRRGLADPKTQAAYAAEALQHPAFEAWPGLDPCLAETVRRGWPMAEVLAQQRVHWMPPPRSSEGTPA